MSFSHTIRIQKGEVGVSICGSMDAYTIVKEMSRKDLTGYALELDLAKNTPEESAFRGIESLEAESDLEAFAEKLKLTVWQAYDLSVYKLHKLSVQGGLTYVLPEDATLLSDRKTDEFLLISGDAIQNDCD